MTKVKLGILELEATEVDEQIPETGKKRVKLTGKIPLKQQNKLLNQLMKKPLSVQMEGGKEIEMTVKSFTYTETHDSLSFSISLEPFDIQTDLDTATLLAIEAVFGRIRIRSLLDLLEEKGIIKPEEYENRFESIAHRDAESVIGNIMDIKVHTKHTKHAHD